MLILRIFNLLSTSECRLCIRDRSFDMAKDFVVVFFLFHYAIGIFCWLPWRTLGICRKLPCSAIYLLQKIFEIVSFRLSHVVCPAR